MFSRKGNTEKKQMADDVFKGVINCLMKCTAAAAQLTSADEELKIQLTLFSTQLNCFPVSEREEVVQGQKKMLSKFYADNKEKMVLVEEHIKKISTILHEAPQQDDSKAKKDTKGTDNNVCGIETGQPESSSSPNLLHIEEKTIKKQMADKVFKRVMNCLVKCTEAAEQLTTAVEDLKSQLPPLKMQLNCFPVSERKNIVQGQRKVLSKFYDDNKEKSVLLEEHINRIVNTLNEALQQKDTKDNNISGMETGQPEPSSPLPILLQQQMQLEQQRAIEASTQMVYEVFGNAIAMLEELERREVEKSAHDIILQKSKIDIKSQDSKTDNDIVKIVEAEILMMEMQLKSCRKEILPTVKNKLQDSMIQWLAGREESGITRGCTDDHAGRLFEVLTLGRTNHPMEFHQHPGDVKGVGYEDMHNVLIAQHKIGELDRKYSDPLLKANPPHIRPGNMTLGAKRLQKIRPNLEKFVDQYLDDRK